MNNKFYYKGYFWIITTVIFMGLSFVSFLPDVLKYTRNIMGEENNIYLSLFFGIGFTASIILGFFFTQRGKSETEGGALVKTGKFMFRMSILWYFLAFIIIGGLYLSLVRASGGMDNLKKLKEDLGLNIPIINIFTTKPVICTQEAKICPDGSVVSRVGSNCEFAICPITKTDEVLASSTQGLVAYKNAEYGFEFSYPKLLAEDDSCKVRVLEEGVFGVGYRILITVINTREMSLYDFVNQDLVKDDIKAEDRYSTVINNMEAVKIAYGFGDSSRYGERVYIQKGVKVSIFDYTFGEVCPAAYKDKDSEHYYYSQIISTFKFLD